MTSTVNYASQRIVIIGGPGGYEAAMVAAASNADVTLIERKATGSAVLTDVVPLKP